MIQSSRSGVWAGGATNPLADTYYDVSSPYRPSVTYIPGPGSMSVITRPFFHRHPSADLPLSPRRPRKVGASALILR